MEMDIEHGNERCEQEKALADYVLAVYTPRMAAHVLMNLDQLPPDWALETVEPLVRMVIQRECKPSETPISS